MTLLYTAKPGLTAITAMDDVPFAVSGYALVGPGCIVVAV